MGRFLEFVNKIDLCSASHQVDLDALRKVGQKDHADDIYGGLGYLHEVGR